MCVHRKEAKNAEGDLLVYPPPSGGIESRSGGTRVCSPISSRNGAPPSFWRQYLKTARFLLENLARYIIRASFPQERMTYLPEESRIIYRLA